MTVVDPVCGMPVSEGTGVRIEYSGRTVEFCTDFCKEQFLRNPHAYEKAAPAPIRFVDWSERRIAYFSMEIALENALPTYSGGLGVLAGDTLRSLADLEIPVVAVSLVYRKGYFQQDIVAHGQVERGACCPRASRIAPNRIGRG